MSDEFGKSRSPSASAARAGPRLHEELLRSLREASARSDPPAARLEGLLRSALLAGLLHGGDRLPSVREVADAWGISRHATARAYATLADARLVETRERSGTFVAGPATPASEPRPATARWLVDVLAQAYEEHRVKIPHLPDLIRSWTASVRLRAACLEAVEDLRVALSVELTRHFGLEASCSSMADLPASAERLPPELRGADLWVTTTWHATELGPLARAADRTLVTATLNPQMVDAVEARLESSGELTIVCVDPAFGSRFRLLHGGRYRDAIEVVRADEPSALASLDRSVPVLLTAAARARLGARADFRLVAPVSPSFSSDFTRALLTHIVRRNVERSPGHTARRALEAGS